MTQPSGDSTITTTAVDTMPAPPSEPQVVGDQPLTLQDLMQRILREFMAAAPDFDLSSLKIDNDYTDARNAKWARPEINAQGVSDDRVCPVNKDLRVFYIFRGEGQERRIYCVPVNDADFTCFTLSGLEKTRTVMSMDTFCSSIVEEMLRAAGFEENEDDEEEEEPLAEARTELREWAADLELIRREFVQTPDGHPKRLALAQAVLTAEEGLTLALKDYAEIAAAELKEPAERGVEE